MRGVMKRFAGLMTGVGISIMILSCGTPRPVVLNVIQARPPASRPSQSEKPPIHQEDQLIEQLDTFTVGSNTIALYEAIYHNHRGHMFTFLDPAASDLSVYFLDTQVEAQDVKYQKFLRMGPREKEHFLCDIFREIDIDLRSGTKP